jgi:anti-sigma regulatory factor (Ser/Thr protein kinase)
MIFEIENYQSLRRAVEELCDFLSVEKVPSDSIFDSKLAVYELLGNVLQHSGGSAKLHGGISDGYVELKISAEKIYCPPPKGAMTECVDKYSEHGRGLFLVDSVCEERFMTDDGGIFIKIKIKK